MNVYLLIFEAVPIKENKLYGTILKADVLCWISDTSPENSYRKALFFIGKYDWEITKLKKPPSKVTENDFIGNDIELNGYIKAESEGMAFVYLGVTKNRQSFSGPEILKPRYVFDPHDYYSRIKEYSKKGRCLHYEAGKRCTEYINAHSIQNKGLLTWIAENGHVYGITADYGRLKVNRGKPSYRKIGINKMSTFMGFCKVHDNELFAPIDNYPLVPNDEQVFLYAYRSLCRELFVKENARANIKSQIKKGIEQKTIRDLYISYEKATHFGLNNLKRHKCIYNTSLKNNNYNDIRYVLFISSQKPTIVFSGLLYPDYDFCERILQDLKDHSSELELITFCSAPIKHGWGYLFSWHKSSSRICQEFMRSLATAIHKNSHASDYHLRLVLSCENHAISPSWWDNLSDDKKKKIEDKFSVEADIFSEVKSDYLCKGIEGVSDWVFDSVIVKMD